MEIFKITLPILNTQISNEELMEAYKNRKEELTFKNIKGDLKCNIPITSHDNPTSLVIDASKIIGSVIRMDEVNETLIVKCAIADPSGKVLKFIKDKKNAPICAVPHLLVGNNNELVTPVKLISFGLGLHNFSDRNIK